jgi:uncharacterized membrane protein YjgN (DUF898 family)
MAAREDLVNISARPDGRDYAIRFTGSGSEYFRIWIVNLLLMLVTLGLYYPWAKVRKRRYFYGNTLVGGHAFDFHGDPKRMLRGYLLMAALTALYGASGHFSSLAALIAVAVLALLWPALFRASQQFRMANTSWRGLRFRFTGGLASAYAAVLPLLVPALAIGLVSQADRNEATMGPRDAPWILLIAMLIAVLTVPLAFWLLKRYQHNHYALGDRRTTLAIGAGRFYGLALKTILLSIATMVAIGAAVTLIFFAVGPGLRDTRTTALPVGVFIAMAGSMFVMYAAVFAVIQPYLTSRMQNMVWSATSSVPVLRLSSALHFGAAARLGLKNFVLTILTLGLYWPFAAVATARLRLEAVTVHLPEGADELIATAQAHQDATGEAAGDLFGIDVGL